MTEIYCPPRNRREAIRNIILSQRKATAAFLEGRPAEFNSETLRGFSMDAYSTQFVRSGESAAIRHRVMYKSYLENSKKRGEFPHEIYSRLTRYCRESFPVSLQRALFAREAA